MTQIGQFVMIALMVSGKIIVWLAGRRVISVRQTRMCAQGVKVGIRKTPPINVVRCLIALIAMLALQSALHVPLVTKIATHPVTFA